MSQAHSNQADAHDSHEDGQLHVHVVPIKILAGVFALLMVLTFMTVAATWVDLGPANIWLALGIAVIKAAFVCLYFMHLRYDSPLYSIIVVLSLLTVGLFIAIPLLDSYGYAPVVKAAPPILPPAVAPATPAAPAAPAATHDAAAPASH